ncbi:MAG: EAL domain-containing protein [Bilifractor sp.]
MRRQNISRAQLEPLLNMEWAKDNRIIHFHLRCGIYYIEDADVSISRMINWTILANRYADQEKYGSYAVFDAAMREKYLDQAEVISRFSESLANEEFKIFYQPIIETASGNICAAEALVRWEHPSRGFLVPGRFIPALEKSGLITQLDHYVMQHVYAFQKALQAENMPIVPVSVNLSRQDFYNDSFMSKVLSLTQESALPPDCINYEVTETSVAILKENCDYLLQQIRQIGAKILLDDFGSGYSSLGMIGDYSFDIVKIDKSFVDQIEDKPVVRAVIDATINMCHSIGLATVAEGVENSRQLSFLREHGCDFIQGYYYSRPLSEKDFHAYLSEAKVASFESNAVSDFRGLCRPDVDNLLDLVDHSDQFIQVCYPENYEMIFANEMTRVISGHPDLPYEGKKCYQYMLGLDAPCGHCPMRRMGDETEKTLEVDDGAHVFRLKARYATWNNRRVFIEYGHDITDTKVVQQRYIDQIRSILESIPAGQGVFHMDLTADKWISSGGNAENARAMQNIKDVDTLIRRIASFVPDPEGQQQFFRVFCRKAQLESYKENRRQIVLETESYYDDHSIRWSRITAHLIDNPETGNIESILYGVDISSEKAHIEELEQEHMEQEQLRRQIDKTWEMYTQADHDRRYDFLTGLNSRLNLYHFAKQHDTGFVTGAMMLDLDNFKRVNDTYGHQSGDDCLREIGRILLDFGTHHNISFYRYGGEEIVGLSQAPQQDFSMLVRQVLELVNSHKIRLSDHNGELISVTVSIGYTTQQDHVKNMIGKADAAMYYAKRQGKKQAACLDNPAVPDRENAPDH